MSNYYLCDYCDHNLKNWAYSECFCNELCQKVKKKVISDDQFPEEVCEGYLPEESDL